MTKFPPGLFITGTDTGVGKTYITAMIAQSLVAEGRKVGVYKPAASGCRREGNDLISDDALALWNAAGRPGALEFVCPQRFEAPLAPHLAAKAEGRQLDQALLSHGLKYWDNESDIVLVEGTGGLMSPMGEEEYVAHLADAFGFPLVVVSRNALGTINQTLQTLITAAVFGEGLPIAGVVLNQPCQPSADDVSLASNHEELQFRCIPPILAEVGWKDDEFIPQVDWYALANRQLG